MQHHMAIRANGNEIIHGIDHITFTDLADGLFVVDFDFPGEFFAKYQTKIKTAYRAGGNGCIFRSGLFFHAANSVSK